MSDIWYGNYIYLCYTFEKINELDIYNVHFLLYCQQYNNMYIVHTVYLR
jgi:hypothetical protein